WPFPSAPCSSSAMSRRRGRGWRNLRFAHGPTRAAPDRRRKSEEGRHEKKSVARAGRSGLSSRSPEGGKDMPRISEVTDDRGDPALKPVFDRQREMFGDLLNPTKILAHCPPILRAAGAMGQAIEQSGQLPKGMLPLIYTRVATING